MTRVVLAGSAEALHSPEAQAAIRAALLLVRQNVVDDFNCAVERSSMSRIDAEARVVRGHIVLGLKHSESDGAAAKWKARVVAAGNNVRDSMGLQVCDILDSSAPAFLGAIRAMIVLGLVGTPNEIIQVDVEAAYLYADLTGRALRPSAGLCYAFSKPFRGFSKAEPCGASSPTPRLAPGAGRRRRRVLQERFRRQPLGLGIVRRRLDLRRPVHDRPRGSSSPIEDIRVREEPRL